MERVAQHLAAFVAAEAPLPAVPDPGYAIERAEARNTGDITRMLDLPAGSTLFPDEAVCLRRVLQADGSLWRSSRDADVLLLGDSFANIYSLESLGWGTSAGLAEQLSDALGRPLDRFVQNDAGAFATREMLAREPGRLDGKRLVIYQFAERELAFGDWKILPLIR
jgi:alginate O-acetyltransferase complex protein AlgJ